MKRREGVIWGDIVQHSYWYGPAKFSYEHNKGNLMICSAVQEPRCKIHRGGGGGGYVHVAKFMGGCCPNIQIWALLKHWIYLEENKEFYFQWIPFLKFFILCWLEMIQKFLKGIKSCISSEEAQYLGMKLSGSVVECLTRAPTAAVSSLTGVTVLCPWARTFILAKYWFNPGRPVPIKLKDCWSDVKNQIEQTNKIYVSYLEGNYITFLIPASTSKTAAILFLGRIVCVWNVLDRNVHGRNVRTEMS